MDNIKMIYQLLDLKNTAEARDEGFRLAEKIEDLTFLILPPTNPSVWEACAEVLYKKSDVQLEAYFCSLLEWLQDLNWPGALTILERLKICSGEKLKGAFLHCFKVAQTLNNDDGLRWMDYLSELLDNKDLKDKLPQSILKILQAHYKNWGFWYNE